MALLYTPEQQISTALNETVSQECSRLLHYICIVNNSHVLLNDIVEKLFTGEDFEENHYDEYLLEDTRQFLFGSPGGWKRPARICENIELLKQVHKWLPIERVKYKYPLFEISTYEDMKKAKETELPYELKPPNVIRMIRNLPGWIDMDSPEMCKEVVYFMTRILRTAHGGDLMCRVGDLYDLDLSSLERIRNLSEQELEVSLRYIVNRVSRRVARNVPSDR